VKLRVTKAGFLYSLVTIFIGVAAANTGNNLLFVMLSLLLSFMWLSGVFARYNLKGLTFEVEPSNNVFAEREAFAIIRVKNEKRLPAFILKVKLRLKSSGNDEETFIIFPQVKDFAEKVVPIFPKERGFATFEIVEISSLFPLSLFVRYLEVKKEAKFVVYPKPLPILLPFDSASGRKRVGERPKDGLGSGEFLGLREYIAFAPRKLIHWKSLAKRDELMLKKLAEEAENPLMVEVEKLPGRTLEEKLSQATFLVLKFESLSLPYGLNLFGKKIPPSLGPFHQKRILTELALYGKEKA
jgi:uncharacterized protein (DUF58 family)